MSKVKQECDTPDQGEKGVYSPIPAEIQGDGEHSPAPHEKQIDDFLFLKRDVVLTVRKALAEKHPDIIKPTNAGRMPHHLYKAQISDREFIERSREPGDDNPLNLFESQLSHERQIEVLDMLLEHFSDMQKWIRKYQKARKQIELTPDDVVKPQWATEASAKPTTFVYDSENEDRIEAKIQQLDSNEMEYDVSEENGSTIITVYGHRVMLAFYKTMCPFKCTYCTLPGANDPVRKYINTHGAITPEIQFEAYLAALIETQVEKQHPPVIEILNDGSWWSDTEIPQQTRDYITEDIAQRDYVQCLAVESRPEYIDVNRVQHDLSRIRPDQKMKIYIGLETTDDFVASVVRKHYGWAEFEAAIERIAELPEQDRERVSVVAYNIMKQWCTTEREALEESVTLAQKVDALSKRLGIEIEVKHEPTIVSQGTAQHYFFHQIDENGERMYKNQSYYTVAELIARLAVHGLEKNVAFGQRDDIDEVQICAMVARPHHDLDYSSLDFIVYDSVQQFQRDGDVEKFAHCIASAIQKPDGSYTEEFLLWEQEVYGEYESELRKLVANLAEPTHAVAEVIEYNDLISQLIDQAHTNEQLRGLAANDDVEQIEAKVIDLFSQHEEAGNFSIFKVNNLLEMNITGEDVETLAVAKNKVGPGYQVEIILRHNNNPSNVWIFIPKQAA